MQQPTPPNYPPTPSAPTYQQPYQLQPTAPRKSNTTLIIAIVIIVVVIVGAIGAIAAIGIFNTLSTATAWHTTSLVNSQVTVQPAHFAYYQFLVPSGATHAIVNGTFTASGGSGNDIIVYVMDQTNFVNYENGHSASTFYNSNQVTTGNINALLPGPGTYYLVYDNTFSTVSSKNVQTTVNLYYQG